MRAVGKAVSLRDIARKWRKMLTSAITPPSVFVGPRPPLKLIEKRAAAARSANNPHHRPHPHPPFPLTQPCTRSGHKPKHPHVTHLHIELACCLSWQIFYFFLFKCFFCFFFSSMCLQVRAAERVRCRFDSYYKSSMCVSVTLGEQV